MTIKFLTGITLGLVMVSSGVFAASPTLNAPYSNDVFNNFKVNSNYGVHGSEMRSMSMPDQSVGVDNAMSSDIMTPMWSWDADSSR
ncbi:hypothetical protein SAMN03080615_00692 [Amphritea atlantica]|uniref:Uncharacterized protein n=1 Tax=Amphritea atlantica TaxID=355243 RepID=A0A1H9E4U0_9GAMM|nr:hypothetical protein [Amphritea atlantica]SEQ20744.1 hypothetical protein SAMN03080615_00692 [Amphritea atlantica]